MKKLYLFLTLVLAIIGIGVTRALILDLNSMERVLPGGVVDGQTVTIGCPISSYNSDPVSFNNHDILFDDGSTPENGKSMLKQVSKTSGDLTPSYAWTLEAGSEDGWFYLKNAETGRYWSFDTKIDSDEEYGDEGVEFYIKLVADKDDAKQFLFSGIQEGIKLINPNFNLETCTFKHVVEAAEERGCLMVMSKIVSDGKTYYYCMNDAVPGGMSNYTDWAGYMDVFSVELISDPFEEFAEYVNNLPVKEYSIGDHPGCVEQQEEAIAYNEKVKEYQLKLDEPDKYTTEQWAEMLEELKAFIANLPKFTFKPVTDGYYRIMSGKNYYYMFLNNNGDGGCRVAPEEASLNDLWQVYTNADGKSSMKNLGTMKYIIPVDENSQSMKGTYEEQTVEFICRNTFTVEGKTFDRSPFNIKCGNYLHTQGTNLLTWWDAAGMGDMWLFEAVTVDDLEETFGEDIMAKLKLNDEFYNLLNEAQAAITRAKSVGEERLINSADQISSPKSQAGEGSIANLIDGDYSTYWHSEWAAGDVSEDNSLHYLQFDLRQSVQLLTMKYCRRPSANDHPTMFLVSASNEADGEYTDIVEFPVAPKEVVVEDVDDEGNPTGETHTEVRNTSGENNVLYSYSLDLGAKYRYIRVLATMTDYWRGYWHASEMYFCLPGVDMWVPVQAEGEALEAAIAEAKAAANAGELTQEVIDALRAAYEAFLNAFPDPTALKELIAQANNELESIQGGKNPGDKPAEAWNALKAAVDAVSAWLEANMATCTKAQLKEQEDKLKAALEVWNAVALNWIDTKHWYHLLAARKFTNHTATDYYEAGTDMYLARFAVNYGDPDAAEKVSNVIGAVVDGMECDEAYAQWRFIDAGNGTFAIQNRGTGQFIEPRWNGIQNSQMTSGVVPGKFFVNALPAGCFEIGTVFGKNSEGEDRCTYLNIYGQGYMGTWSYGGRDDVGSVLKIAEVEEIAADHEQMITLSTAGTKLRGLVLPYSISLAEMEGDACFYTDVTRISQDDLEVELTEETEAIAAGKPFIAFNDNTTDEVNVAKVKMGEAKLKWDVDNSGVIVGTLNVMGDSLRVGVLEPTVSVDDNNSIGEIWGAFATLKAARLAHPGEAWIDIHNNLGLLDSTTEGDQVFVLDLTNGEIRDAIEVVKGENSKYNVIYNLNGQRVSAPVKGVMIMNGKKYIVK